MAKVCVYTEALEAVKKNRPTKVNRARIDALFDAISSATGAREQYFYAWLLRRSILGNEALAGKVYDATPRIGKLLSSFAEGRPIPNKDKQIVTAFLTYWHEFAENERERYEGFVAMHKRLAGNPHWRNAVKHIAGLKD